MADHIDPVRLREQIAEFTTTLERLRGVSADAVAGVAQVVRERDALRAEVEKLRAFKSYVHSRLDDAGVPVDPPGPHRDAGCRIGQRLDVVLGDGRHELRRETEAHLVAGESDRDAIYVHRERTVRSVPGTAEPAKTRGAAGGDPTRKAGVDTGTAASSTASPGASGGGGADDEDPGIDLSWMTPEILAALKAGLAKRFPERTRPLPRDVDGFPRRNRLDLATPMERAIRAAMAAIEAGPADVRMTRASIAVQDALAWVADYYEDVPVSEHYPRAALDGGGE